MTLPSPPASPPAPALARRLLEWRLREPTRSWILGDLEERFRALARRSPLRARLWYWRQTLWALVLPVPGAPRRTGASRGPGRELAQAFRALRRRPGQALAAVLPLGLGIGVVTTAFAIVWGTVVAGLPFEEADRLVHFERARLAAGETSLAVTPHDYLDWRSAQRSFEELGAFVEREVVLPTEAGPPERRVGVAINAVSFDLLRAEAMLGRTFTPEDEEPGGPPVILLGHDLWEARFGADPRIVGEEIVVDGRPTVVVGVMPAGFGFPVAEELWVPLRLDLSTLERGRGRLDVFGRLRDGVSVEAARAEFQGITEGLARAHPETNAGITASLRTFQEEYVGEDFRNTVFRLLAGALLVLLVCCANVANLLLVRGVARARDLAVRRALGATRGDLVGQLLAEALLLAAAGGALGLLLAGYGVAWFNRVGAGAGVFDLPHGGGSLFWWDVGLNAPTILAAVATAGLAAILAGVAPALRSSAGDGLARGGRTARMSGEGRLQRGAVLGQLALTAALLVAAGFVAESVGNVADTRVRFVREDVLVLGLALPTSLRDGGGAYDDPGARLRFVRSLEERLRSDPAVAAAAFTTAVPLETPLPSRVVLESEREAVETGVVSVTPDFFRAFGVEAAEGRLLGEGDGPGDPPVALVNRSFAARFLPGRPSLGARIRLGGAEAQGEWVEVVGVVPDLWERPREPAREAGVYLPLAQVDPADPMPRVGRWGLAYPTLVVRERRPGAVGRAGIERHVTALDAGLPIRRLERMGEVADRHLGRYLVWGRFWLAFAGAALLLAALGIYGVLSFRVAQRSGEIGVRRALGASGGSVQREVVVRALKDVGLAVPAGLWLGGVLAGALGQVLYGVEPARPAVYLSVAGLVAGTALLASWLPARRAARIDPREAMRPR